MADRSTAVVWTAILVAALFTFLAVGFLSAGIEAIDDAYISFRYAWNLAEGHGLLYNPGEEAVQGYTNFLWVLLIFLALAAGLPPVETACGAGFAAGLGTVVLTSAWSVGRLAPGRAAAAVAPVLLVANLGFVVWSIRGLETGLFTLLLLAAGLLYVRRPLDAALSPWVTLLLALATLTRPEGALAFALTLLHLVLSRRIRGVALVRWGDLRGLAIFAVLVGIYGGWCVAYYGDPLPNTFRAKVGAPLDSLPRGVQYLWNFARYGSGWPLLLLPVALARRHRADATRSYAALMVAGFALYVALVGGDVFPAYRFLVPVFPFLYLLVGDAVAGVEERMSRPWARTAPRGETRAAVRLPRAMSTMVVGLLLAILALATHRPSSAFAWREWSRGNRYTAQLRMVGRWLRGEFPPDTWIAVNPAGALPYESRLPTIDMLGLNDREIARTPVERLGSGRLAGHEKGNGRSVFDRRPEIILIGGVKLDPPPVSLNWTPRGRSERELWRIPELYEVYSLESRPMEDGRVLTFLRLRDRPVPSLPADP
jgi:hypothetical protein